MFFQHISLNFELESHLSANKLNYRAIAWNFFDLTEVQMIATFSAVKPKAFLSGDVMAIIQS